MLSMLIFAAASAAQPHIVVPGPDAPAASTVGYPRCHDKGVQTVQTRPNAPVRVQKLNELPNADEYLTVMRIDENGCPKPAIVAYDIGSAPAKQR